MASTAVDPNFTPLQAIEANGHPSNWVPLLQQPLYTPTRKLRVVCVGAGYAGLMLASKVQNEWKMEDFVDLQIYEKNGDVGGTWLENRYPGVACDVPAHGYTFSFEPNPDWSSYYAGGPEIWEYIRRTTSKYRLDKNVKFNARVISSIWDDEACKWNITINQSGKEIHDTADILVNGAGILNKWKWPKIEGLETFKGNVLHSAQWDQSFDWTGKKIAVIGNGSSAIQIVPQLCKTAAHVENYIRSKTWICPPFIAEYAKDGGNFEYTEEQKQDFRKDPEKLRSYRKQLEHSFNSGFGKGVFFKNTDMAKMAYDGVRKLMESRLQNDPGLIAKLVPDFEVGCRRPTPGEGYLESLQGENGSMNFSEIRKITETGIQTVEDEKDYDAIVCATGFDVSFCPFWEIVGKNGRRLERDPRWANGDPQAYFGICIPDLPNYFMFLGPNCPIGHGSLLPVIEWIGEYILRWVRKISEEDIRSVNVKYDAVDDFNIYSQEFLKNTIWAGGCRSWYKNGKVDGKVTAMYAGSILHYKANLERARGEDFDIKYCSKNKFRFLGNGLTEMETDGSDLSFYVR